MRRSPMPYQPRTSEFFDALDQIEDQLYNNHRVQGLTRSNLAQVMGVRSDYIGRLMQDTDRQDDEV